MSSLVGRFKSANDRLRSFVDGCRNVIYLAKVLGDLRRDAQAVALNEVVEDKLQPQNILGQFTLGEGDDPDRLLRAGRSILEARERRAQSGTTIHAAKSYTPESDATPRTEPPSLAPEEAPEKDGPAS